MTALADISQPTPPEPAPRERRRSSRHDVSLPVEVLTVDGVPLSGVVTNISATGLRAFSPMALAKGTRVIVRLHGRKRRRAYIAWQIGEEIGCRLQRALTPEELAGLLA